MKKIKAIVFDYDGVIELRDKGLLDSVLSLLGVTLEEFREVYYLYNRRTNIENLPWIDVLLLVSEKLGANSDVLMKIRKLSEENNKTITLNIELIDYIKNYLKPRGYMTGILSNNTTDLHDKISRHGIVDLFDVVLVSAEVGYQKPEKEFFEILFSKLRVDGDEVVFTDDNKKPLETAGILGYFPILFENNEQFKKDLENVINNS